MTNKHVAINGLFLIVSLFMNIGNVTGEEEFCSQESTDNEAFESQSTYNVPLVISESDDPANDEELQKRLAERKEFEYLWYLAQKKYLEDEENKPYETHKDECIPSDLYYRMSDDQIAGREKCNDEMETPAVEAKPIVTPDKRLCSDVCYIILGCASDYSYNTETICLTSCLAANFGTPEDLKYFNESVECNNFAERWVEVRISSQK